MATNGSYFDFVINHDVYVLAIEAGVNNLYDIKAITTPSLAMDHNGSISHRYRGYKTTLVNRDGFERVETPDTRAIVLGGSVNHFAWTPGCKVTFDAWGEYGGKDRTWNSLLPYLRKSATYHDDGGLHPAELRKIGPGSGPTHISHAEALDDLQPLRNVLTNAHIYDGEMNGLTHCVDTVYNGQRHGSWLFVKDKPNVTILPLARSKNLIIDETERVCKGVSVCLPFREEREFYTRREVILSEGVFGTPKLLMLSGICPAAKLAKHGITKLVDLSTMDDYILRKGPRHDAAVATYKQSRIGPVVSNAAYRKAKTERGGQDSIAPYGQLHLELDFIALFGDAFQWYASPPTEGNYFTVVVDLVRPVSEPGCVTLESADPLAHPRISADFFADSEAFKDLVVAEYPPQTKMPLGSDEETRRAILERCQTSFHPVGRRRCRGVLLVDPKFKFMGLESACGQLEFIPVIPDCRIQDSVYMVWERCADLVKEAHGDLYYGLS
ncbi:hypothetical protein BDW71DRAFT_199138 [Aspergillus fruticulosus]